MMSLEKKENLMADKIRMGAGGVPYKAKSEEPKKDEVISEVLVENPNKKPKKEEKKDEKF